MDCEFKSPFKSGVVIFVSQWYVSKLGMIVPTIFCVYAESCALAVKVVRCQLDQENKIQLSRAEFIYIQNTS